MPILTYTINADQGADVDYTFTYQQQPANPLAQPTIVNVAGYTAECMVRRVPADAAPLISVSTTANAQGVIVMGGALGTVALAIYGTAMLALPMGFALTYTFTYQLLLISPSGVRIPLVGGPMIVTATPTYP
jgi:uncharacterized iron-regulated membrane protein